MDDFRSGQEDEVPLKKNAPRKNRRAWGGDFVRAAGS
jgi:hypothetical protein